MGTSSSSLLLLLLILLPLQVAEAVQRDRQSNSAEQDYEEVITLLEAEIKDLKNQLAGKKQKGLEATKVDLKPINGRKD